MIPSDFHRGNYVSSKSYGICRVITTNGDVFRLFTRDGRTVETEDAIPLFLTDDALKAIPGVVCKKGVFTIGVMPGYLIKNSVNICYEWILFGLPIRTITFIHELQQLYKATTTEELYKPKNEKTKD